MCIDTNHTALRRDVREVIVNGGDEFTEVRHLFLQLLFTV